MNNTTSDIRIQGVDSMRVLAILAVIIIHTTPFASDSSLVGSDLNVSTILTQLARFAVPFFFTISGYFWAGKFLKTAPSLHPSANMARRIAFIFLFWSVIYLVQASILDSSSFTLQGMVKTIYWNAISLSKSPSLFLLQGTKSHLWFLSSLLICLVISSVLISKGMTRILVIFSLILYLIGLMGKAYTDAPFGFHSQFNFRNGPFFGLVFFVTGYLLHRNDQKSFRFGWGVLLTALGMLIHFIELIVINRFWGTTMNQDYLLGTYFTGIGVTLLALSDFTALRISFLSFAGPLVLGIYSVHFIFVDLLKSLSSTFSGTILWELGYPVSVLFLSVLTAFILSRSRLTRMTVT